jgi:glycosyltransferase involved in cell wall biosynthesis
MPLVSVLTAVHGDRADVLAAAGASVRAQELPAGWRLEWVVQEDGPDPGLAGAATGSEYAANGEQLGVAVTRNLALARVRGELVRVLDSDDLLLPGALAEAIEAFTAHPRIHWVSGRPALAHGSYFQLLPEGVHRPGVIGAYVREHRRAPIHCAGLTARTATVRALGGWCANPRAEDIELVAALSELTPGYVSAAPSWLYRSHDGQTVRHSRWRELHAESYLMIHQRIAAARELRLRMGTN